ncbi:hypothetical protein TorRG33x02_228800, partial [Trema orientale]
GVAARVLGGKEGGVLGWISPSPLILGCIDFTSS